ncbi:MAG TPA: glycosyltransferase family 9 protein [Candidatus Krumholzibacteria bacterium]|nr:glycosyltransferase family 9 protein [Candidatus Krumholzibacteria bacterium]
MTRRDDWLLVIRLRQLGDVLAALDTVRAMKEYRPERKIAYVVDRPFDSLLGGFTFIDRVMPPPRGEGAGTWMRYLASLRSLRAQAVVDFHGSARSAMLSLVSGAPLRVGFDVRARGHAYTVREPRGEFRDGVRVPHTALEWGTRLARHVGALGAADLPPAFPADAAGRAAAHAQLCAAGIPAAALGAGRVVGLNPGRPVPTKSWSVERFAEIAHRVVAAGGHGVVFWGPGEEAVARAVVERAGSGTALAPRFSLPQLPGALRNLAALVTIDSGLKHLAVCARVPTVTVFGATDPREWHMGGDRDAYLWRGLSCSPCRRLECPFGAPCMDLGTDAVFAALTRILGWAA